MKPDGEFSIEKQVLVDAEMLKISTTGFLCNSTHYSDGGVLEIELEIENGLGQEIELDCLFRFSVNGLACYARVSSVDEGGRTSLIPVGVSTAYLDLSAGREKLPFVWQALCHPAVVRGSFIVSAGGAQTRRLFDTNTFQITVGKERAAANPLPVLYAGHGIVIRNAEPVDVAGEKTVYWYVENNNPFNIVLDWSLSNDTALKSGVFPIDFDDLPGGGYTVPAQTAAYLYLYSPLFESSPSVDELAALSVAHLCYYAPHAMVRLDDFSVPIR